MPPIEANEKPVLIVKAASYTVEVSESNKPAVIKALPRFTITRIDSTINENVRLDTA
jgi:hypothetical protein